MLRPFFTYFGSKWATIRYYPPPTHRILIEPFAGAASYATHYPDLDVKLFDKNPIIAGVWRYLIRTSAAEIRALPLLEEGQCVDELHVCEEARWLIGFWLNKSQTSPAKRASAWARTKEWAYQFWSPGRRERVAAQVERIRHWQIFERSYESAPNIEASWFIDPPYIVAGKQYPYGNDQIDYDALGRWCQRRQGQIIVCENGGAAWLPFRLLLEKPGTFKRRPSLEMIWP